jgi:hypothetical protein
VEVMGTKNLKTQSRLEGGMSQYGLSLLLSVRSRLTALHIHSHSLATSVAASIPPPFPSYRFRFPSFFFLLLHIWMRVLAHILLYSRCPPLRFWMCLFNMEKI